MLVLQKDSLRVRLAKKASDPSLRGKKQEGSGDVVDTRSRVD